MRVSHAPRVVGRRIEGRVVVVRLTDLESRELNEVGGRVWELADGRTVEEIANEVAREFDVPRERARADVEAFASELVAERWLRIEP